MVERVFLNEQKPDETSAELFQRRLLEISEQVNDLINKVSAESKYDADMISLFECMKTIAEKNLENVLEQAKIQGKEEIVKMQLKLIKSYHGYQEVVRKR